MFVLYYICLLFDSEQLANIPKNSKFNELGSKCWMNVANILCTLPLFVFGCEYSRNILLKYLYQNKAKDTRILNFPKNGINKKILWEWSKRWVTKKMRGKEGEMRKGKIWESERYEIIQRHCIFFSLHFYINENSLIVYTHILKLI